MAIQINYDDDIFLLQTMIKTLSAAIRLEVDPELFREKIIEDTLFIHTTIQKLFRGLYDNPRLLRRMEHLRGIMRLKATLVEALDICLDSETPMYVDLAAHAARLRAFRNEHLEQIDDIKSLLQRRDEEETEDEDVVSQEEFQSLLQRDDDGETP